MNQSETEMTIHLWEFIRGGIPVKDFESWVYSSPELESFLGKDLYHSLISVDFSSPEAIDQMVKQIQLFTNSLSHGYCSCVQLPNLAVIDMDPETMQVMASFTRFKERGQPYWWLYAVECSACGQPWLVAQDESHNDVFCLYRLTKAERAGIVNADHWPVIFDRYDDVKLFGLKTGARLPFGDSDHLPLVWTITRLAKDQPGIHSSEIASKLHLQEGFAQSLCDLAKRSFGADIRP